MPFSELPKPSFPEVIDNTMRGEFTLCPRKFYHSYILNLTPSSESVHLIAGAAFAKGLEVTRQAVFDRGLSLEDALELGAAALLLEYGDHDFGPDENKGPEKMVGALVRYFDEHPPLTDVIQPYRFQGRAAVEVSFALPLNVMHPDTGQPILYAGRYDMLGVYNGQAYVVDEKTTGRLGPTWAQQWNLRAQFMGYVWAAQQFGISCSGAIVRGVCILKRDYTFAMAVVPIMPDMLSRWYRQLELDVLRMIELYKADYFDYALDTHACHAYFSPCAFINACSSSSPERWLKTMEPRTWSPLKINNVKEPGHVAIG